MDEDGFRNYLFKGGISDSAANRCLRFVSEFEVYLQDGEQSKCLDDAQDEDLVAFVKMLDEDSKTKAKGYLWSLRYYYEFTSNVDLVNLAARMREERIDRKPIPLKEFRGVDPGYVKNLAEAGIKNVDQMLNAGATPKERIYPKQLTFPNLLFWNLSNWLI
jgi:hypothetical protein